MKILSLLKLLMLSVAVLFTLSNLKTRFYSNEVNQGSLRFEQGTFNKSNLFQTTVSSENAKVRDIGIPMYFTVHLLESFDVERLDLHGYHSLYHFFMGFVGDPISYKNGCNWAGSKNSTIKGMSTYLYFKSTKSRLY